LKKACSRWSDLEGHSLVLSLHPFTSLFSGQLG